MDQAYHSISTFFNSFGELVKTDKDDREKSTAATLSDGGGKVCPQVDIPFGQVCPAAAVVSPSPKAHMVDSNHFQASASSMAEQDRDFAEGNKDEAPDLQPVTVTETDIAGLQYATGTQVAPSFPLFPSQLDSHAPIFIDFFFKIFAPLLFVDDVLPEETEHSSTDDVAAAKTFRDKKSTVSTSCKCLSPNPSA
jgi:hypothetical protein